MPSLILQFEDRVLKAYGLTSSVTIGRLHDNSIVIDNPAVSGHHARILEEAGQVIVEDLNSTNGTFVNEKRVTRHVLKNGDVVLVGKHKLVFDEAGNGSAGDGTAAAPVLSNMGDTVYLDTAQHRALLSKLKDSRGNGGSPTGQLEKYGVLHVLSGRSDRPEYELQGHTSVIGSGKASHIRLLGWFKPRIAVAITRKGDDYVATRLGGTAHINGQRLDSRQDLKDGDVLRVSGLTVQFRLR